MAAIAGRAALWGARRFGPALVRGAWQLGRRFAPMLARNSARVAGRIGTNIPMRTLGQAGRSLARRQGFNTMRRMGTRAFATGAARGASRVGWRTAAAGVAAAGAAAGVYQNTRSGQNANKGSNSKAGKAKQNKEQLSSADQGDNIATSDTFTHKQGDETKIKSLPLISGKRQIVWNTTGGLLGKQGIAVWGFLRYKPYGETDANFWHTTGSIQDADKETYVNYDIDGETWQKDKTKNQLGFLDRKFIIDSVNTKYEFKNQSSDSVHLEYYVVAYGHSGQQRNLFNDVRDGYYAKSGTNTATLANYPVVITETENGGAMESNTEITLGGSSTFRANWNILYKHKVKIPEGGQHNFNYHQNSNRIMNFDAMYRRNDEGTALQTNYDTLKNITFCIIYKVYGELGDNSNAINTVNTNGVTLGDSKVIYRCKTVLTYRQSYGTPNIIIQKGTALPTNLSNVYTKDGNTGALEDSLVE